MYGISNSGKIIKANSLRTISKSILEGSETGGPIVTTLNRNLRFFKKAIKLGEHYYSDIGITNDPQLPTAFFRVYEE